jgi:two-component sensor histidine kinase
MPQEERIYLEWRTLMYGTLSLRAYVCTMDPVRMVIPWVFLASAVPLSAQRVPIQVDSVPRTISSVRLFSAEEGLPDRMVSSITEDERGFIWLATKQGLVRFDGNSFENHTRDHGLLQDAVSRVVRDRDGLLWLMFDDGSVQLMDPFTRRPMTLQEYFSDRMPVECRPPYSGLHVADNGLVVLAQLGHLVWYGGKTGGFRRHALPVQKPVLVSRVDDDGDLWCTIFNGSGGVNDLYRVSFAQGWSGHVPPSCTLVKRNIWHFLTGTDHFGSRSPKGMYFGTGEVEGWAEPDGTVAPFPPKWPGLLEEVKDYMYAYIGDGLWVVNARIRRFAPGSDPRLAEVVVDMHEMYPQTRHSVNAVLRDHAGRIWVGTSFGLLLVELMPDRFKRWFVHPEPVHSSVRPVRGMVVVKDRLFLNLEFAGYLIAHAVTGEMLDSSGVRQSRYAVLPTDGDRVWECNRVELNEHDVVRGSTLRTVRSIADVIWCGWQASDGRYLLGSHSGTYWFDGNGTVERIAQPDFPEYQTTPVWHFRPDGDHVLACTASGIYQLDLNGVAVRRYWTGAPDAGSRLPADDIRHIYVDGSGIHWLATATRGLVRWDRHAGTWRLFNRSAGMPQAALHAIYPDSTGRLWVPTDNGLVRFQPQDERVEVFTTGDGISHNEFNRISHTRGPDGTLYFGGLNGITVFHPDRMGSKVLPRPSPLILKALYVQAADGVRVDHTLNVLEGHQLVMAPTDKFLGLELVLLCYDKPERVRYAWRIDGLDSEWNFQREPSLRFTTLPFGEHRLRLRGLDREGVWSEELTVPIRVLRPIHLRWWFIATVIVLVAAIVYAGMRYRIMQLRHIMKVRDRIAMDLHDEVGSSLSRILLFSSAVAGHRDKLPQAAATMLDRITRNSSKAIEDMNDIVWSVNAMHDQMADVLDRMQAYAQQLCDAAGFVFTIIAPESLRQRKLGMEQRRTLYLVFKEAVNNAVKHSGGAHIEARLQITGTILELVVEDDGHGLGPVAVPTTSMGGHGLGNMQRRAAEAGGFAKIGPATGGGTRVLLSMDIGG